MMTVSESPITTQSESLLPENRGIGETLISIAYGNEIDCDHLASIVGVEEMPIVTDNFRKALRYKIPRSTSCPNGTSLSIWLNPFTREDTDEYARIKVVGSDFSSWKKLEDFMNTTFPDVDFDDSDEAAVLWANYYLDLLGYTPDYFRRHLYVTPDITKYKVNVTNGGLNFRKEYAKIWISPNDEKLNQGIVQTRITLQCYPRVLPNPTLSELCDMDSPFEDLRLIEVANKDDLRVQGLEDALRENGFQTAVQDRWNADEVESLIDQGILKVVDSPNLGDEMFDSLLNFMM
ncbi:MAG: hypothetical protein COV45_06015 [Deltaproteobacteria bacterium CG11_big_fil_rev_8_21_14_0_20_47_16]|nr:MAG: hypothetical protein COV45_06015 [Deltaproteobacteria bacterium CG11_big_fil_rev_8_21_14_0_20_47_16]